MSGEKKAAKAIRASDTGIRARRQYSWPVWFTHPKCTHTLSHFRQKIKPRSQSLSQTNGLWPRDARLRNHLIHYLTSHTITDGGEHSSHSTSIGAFVWKWTCLGRVFTHKHMAIKTAVVTHVNESHAEVFALVSQKITWLEWVTAGFFAKLVIGCNRHWQNKEEKVVNVPAKWLSMCDAITTASQFWNQQNLLTGFKNLRPVSNSINRDKTIYS